MLFERPLRRPLVALTLAAGLAALPAAQAPRPPALTVFAASDLGPTFQTIVPQFEKKAGAKVTLVLGSTGTLAQQIRNGAPADLFFAANESAIEEMVPDGLIIAQTKRRYARGRVVIITLKSGPVRVNTMQDLADPGVRRIAIANPAHAPYGLAALQALERANLWEPLRPKLVYGENVQQAVQFVRSGSAEAGIVARSVAEAADLNWQIIEARLHEPLNQMAVVLARTKQRRLASSFLDYVDGPQGRGIMRNVGFLLPGEDF